MVTVAGAASLLQLEEPPLPPMPLLSSPENPYIHCTVHFPHKTSVTGPKKIRDVENR